LRSPIHAEIGQARFLMPSRMTPKKDVDARQKAGHDGRV
jgi:hypothetical protein